MLSPAQQRSVSTEVAYNSSNDHKPKTEDANEIPTHKSSTGPSSPSDITRASVSASNNAPKKAAFVHKLYAMLSDPELSQLIWWTPNTDNGTFALQPGAEFAHALTGYFKHGNVASFVRQLHMYGFHKVCDQPSTSPNGGSQPVWEFIHSSGMFKNGDESSLLLIKRRTSSNTSKIKSELNRSLTSTPIMDSPYAQNQPQKPPMQSIPPPPPLGTAYYYPTLYVSYQPSMQQIPTGLPYPVIIPAQQPQPIGPPPPPQLPQSVVQYPIPQRYSTEVPLVPAYQVSHHYYQPYPPQPQPPHVIGTTIQRSTSQPLNEAPVHQMAPTTQGNPGIPPAGYYYKPFIQEHEAAPLQSPHPQMFHLPPQQVPQQHPYPHQNTSAGSQAPRQASPKSTQANVTASRSSTPHSQLDPRSHNSVDRLSNMANEIMYGQQVLSAKSELVARELHDISNDTLNVAETVPSVKLEMDEKKHKEFQSRLTEARSGISNRMGSSLENGSIDAQRRQSQEHTASSRSQQASIVSNSSQISFYENSRPRMASMFVDPLAPIPPEHQQSQSSGSQQPSTPSNSQVNHIQSPSSSSPMGGLQRKTLSVVNIAMENSETSKPHVPLRRYGSYPELNASSDSQGVVLRLPLALNTSPGGRPMEQVTIESRNSSLTSNPRSSIPGFGHLHSQIRPSLVEMHRSTSPANVSSSIASGSGVSGNSIFSNKASISTVSSSVRNSIPQLLNESDKAVNSLTSNPDHKPAITNPHQHLTGSTTSPKPTTSSITNPQSYTPQAYTQKYFNYPATTVRNGSTVSPQTVRHLKLSSGVKREGDSVPTSDTLHDEKRHKLDNSS